MFIRICVYILANIVPTDYETRSQVLHDYSTRNKERYNPQSYFMKIAVQLKPEMTPDITINDNNFWIKLSVRYLHTSWS